MVTLKRPEEVARMRHAGTILADVLSALEGELRPGVSTAELDAIAERMIRGAGAIPSFLGYGGSRGTIPFPGSICVSINDEVVHGIPSGRRRIEDGDVVGLDIGCIWQGWHADTARTFAIGALPERLTRLIDATRRGMDAGIAAAVPGNRLGDIGAAVEGVAREHGYGVVRHLVGHGIGTAMHEDPQVPNYGRPGTGMRIEAGMCFAIEPMFNLGGDDVALLDDGWTVVTADGSISAHFEDTIAVTPSGPEVLTRA
ncbi:MAG TPA: type I methionyl aminopeptidase [Candidatus Limnocylindria bacterium]|jgi:methionyl aminopeptidase|nr:type I methionyl aminopeptidase [Candidatus Limnocylindria bacterium]